VAVAARGQDGAATACTGSWLYLLNTADVDGNSTDTNETWTMAFNGSGTPTGNVVLNPGSVTLTCDTSNTATTVNCGGGGASTRAGAWVTAINLYTATTGISASSSGGTVTITQLGNTTDSNVTISIVGLASAATHVDGTSPITSGAWATSNLPSAGLTSPSGAGGMIIANARTDIVGAAQVYFGQLSATGNAIQASQAGLQ